MRRDWYKTQDKEDLSERGWEMLRAHEEGNGERLVQNTHALKITSSFGLFDKLDLFSPLGNTTNLGCKEDSDWGVSASRGEVCGIHCC